MPTQDMDPADLIALIDPAVAGTVITTTSDGIVVTDAQNRVLYVNPAFTRITGYQPEEVIGREPSIWKSGRYRPQFYRRMWQVLLEKGLWEGELWNRNKAGQEFCEWLRIHRVRLPGSETVQHVAVFTDLTARRRAQARAVKDQTTDRLTGLPNRLRFTQAVRHALAASVCPAATVMVVNIDQFRRVNDQLGHEAGDKVLIQVAKRLRQRLRSADLLARLAGDEFAVLLLNPVEPEEATRLAGDLLDQVADVGRTAGLGDPLSASIGIVVNRGPAADPSEEAELMLRNAIAAVDDARRGGPHRIAVHTEESAARRLQRQIRERALRQALDDEALQLHFQPKVDVRTGRMIGAEALVRWHQKGVGDIPPAQFIPLAEESGLIGRIGDLTLLKAVAALRSWQEAGLPPLPIAVNVSALQLDGRQLARRLRELLRAAALPPGLLEIEVTETAFANDMDTAIAELEAVRALGVPVALDDFGTGYATLALLQRLPVDTLKIDRSFVAAMLDSHSADAIVRMVIALAKALGKDLVAEGIETEDQARRLLELGCEGGQGWHYAAAMPLEALMEFARRQDAQSSAFPPAQRLLERVAP